MVFFFPTSLVWVLAMASSAIHLYGFSTTTTSGRTTSRVGSQESNPLFSNTALPMVSLSNNENRIGLASDSFLQDYFNSDISDLNMPPSMNLLRKSFLPLAQGSDIRGHYVATPKEAKGARSFSALAHAVGRTGAPALTPFAAHCLGHAFATMVRNGKDREVTTICLGRDPREHGVVLADAFARGASSVEGVKVVYTGMATTPALFEFCRSSLCDGGVMVTASHLPKGRNGFKFFDKQGGFQKGHIQQMVVLAQEHAQTWFDMGVLPPTSGSNGVFCSELVDWMPFYEDRLKEALRKQVDHGNNLPLDGLKIVLNSGNGSGGFFRRVLQELGANMEGSIHTMPDGDFANGVPNPENASMIQETINACEKARADLGILLDTDADRCGMVAPRTYAAHDVSCVPSNYEPLNRNRLIAIMGVIYAVQSPGCAIVTDSVTSTGLTSFLEHDLGLKHVRFLRGYANVISKAQELNKEGLLNAKVAIETSGHCAVEENGFLDDGTFTAVKILGLLAQQRQKTPEKSLLDRIASLQELDEVVEFRLPSADGTLESMFGLFDFVALEIESMCDGKQQNSWVLDRDNLEGIRVSTGADGGYFLLRKSLHDPVMCLQVEASSKESAIHKIVDPLLRLFHSQSRIAHTLDLSSMRNY